MKALRAFVLGAALLAAGFGPASAGVSPADAEQACASGLLNFLIAYEQDKQHLTRDQILDNVLGSAVDREFREVIARFVRADFAGDKAAAQKALEESFAFCVADLINPSVEM